MQARPEALLRLETLEREVGEAVWIMRVVMVRVLWAVREVREMGYYLIMRRSLLFWGTLEQ